MSNQEQPPGYPQPAPQPQGYYGPEQGYQPTGAVPYPGYGPRKPSPIAGGVWGLVLLILAGTLTLIGLIAFIMFLAADMPIRSPYVTSYFLVPGLILDGIFLATQALLTKK
ncbi:MAG: hypothetical protein LBD97_01845 [Bifidobacteriaceae bacterium]|jgi:hypothetical protein|nr:hypothetical protein [Bifidobacteriaceae bacterium]